jgi:hypothetical protein
VAPNSGCNAVDRVRRHRCVVYRRGACWRPELRGPALLPTLSLNSGRVCKTAARQSESHQPGLPASTDPAPMLEEPEKDEGSYC